MLVDENGFVTEGSKSNIFFLKENTLITPKTEQVLPGITRMKVIQIARRMGIKLLEEKISNKSLKLYESAFISGTSPKILPIRNIDEIQFNTKNDTIKKVMDEYELMVSNDILLFNWDNYDNVLPNK
ncbi:MAG: aminotransferase class IV [Bacteroidetes bacterium]|nr:aminotransferase class IV [Bacteroidota bacterium]